MVNIPSSVKTAFFTVFFIFLSLYVFTKVLGPVPFSVNSITTTKTDLFTVQGTGEATAVPDTAVMSIGVTKNASTVENAQNEVNTSVKLITQGLENLGVSEEKIKTTNYSINPNYDYSNGRNNITSYSVTQNIRVEITPIEKANAAIDLASENGANMVSNIQFTVDDEEKAKLEDKARADAIIKAKKKAESIAKTAGIRLGKLINVQESGSSYPQPYYDSLKLAGDEADPRQTELQPGENTTTLSVTLSYETL